MRYLSRDFFKAPLLALILTVGLCSVLAGCVKTLPPPPPQPKTTVSSGFDDVWESVLDLFAERGWGISVIEKDSGVITSEDLRVSTDHEYSKAAECQNMCWLCAESYKTVQLRFFVRRKSETKTDLIVKSFWKKLDCDVYGISCRWMECVSLGQVELDVINEIVSGNGL